MKPEQRPWFILACIAVAGGLIIAAVATRYRIVVSQPEFGVVYQLDQWTGQAIRVWQEEAWAVPQATPVASAPR